MTSPPVRSGHTVLLVEDGSGVTALATARSLAAAGWRVVIGAPGGQSIATVSRACRDSGVVRHINSVTTTEWLGDVRDVAARTGARVVVPCGDAELLLLSEHRDLLPGITLPYPAHARVVSILDKMLLSDAAGACGLNSPLTEAAAAGHVPSFAGRAVVKPRVHGVVDAADRVETVVTQDGVAALRRADDVRAAGAQAIYQEPIDGWLVAHVVVRSRSGVVLARSHQRASRVYPVPAGNCVRGALEPAPPDLVAAVDRLLDQLQWWGLVQLEFLADTGGRLHLIDANPRPYGTMALAEAAGMSLCDTWLCDALGEHAWPTIATSSAHFQALGLDLRRAARQRTPSLIADLTATMLAGRGAVRPVWSAQDPAPFWRQARAVTKRVPARIRRVITRREARAPQ